ncbi:hypothetical protein ZWY2020_031845 [Hordeum vulgare]|nr:hypothetical protein ZWY2020_031845 [Hordeum vulgare]
MVLVVVAEETEDALAPVWEDREDEKADSMGACSDEGGLPCCTRGHCWRVEGDIASGANNLVPIEIALKIATKININQRFSAYIVLPMWPEGKPTGLIAQRIIY